MMGHACTPPEQFLSTLLSTSVFEKVGLWEIIPGGKKIKGEELDIFWSQNPALCEVTGDPGAPSPLPASLCWPGTVPSSIRK